VQDDCAEQQRIAGDREYVGEVERKAVQRPGDNQRIGDTLRPGEERDQIPSAPPHAMPAPIAAAFDGTRGTTTTSAVINAAMISATN